MNSFNLETGSFLLVDKPLHWTSFNVVKKVNVLLKQKLGKKIKVGHAGTLDPLATGLLILGIGKFTKKLEEVQAQTKVYTGEFTLGATTPSFDGETEIDQRYEIKHINEALIHETTKKFVGEIEQIPPMFSAIKVNGKRLYKHARKGEVVEIDPRKITIDIFDITSVEIPKVEFFVQCSKGTYIRSMARDFGEALGAGAYLTALRRTKIGNYDIKDALTIGEVETHIQNLEK